MSCSKHDKVMFNIINSLEKTKFKFSWWKANNVSVTFTNTSLKCAIQIELNSIVERAERISGLETENQNSHFLTLRKKFTFFQIPAAETENGRLCQYSGNLKNSWIIKV